MNRRVSGLLLVSLALAACSTPSNQDSSATGPVVLEGTVTYRERMALPPDAMVKVEIRDVSLQDAPAATIASTQFISDGKQVPIPFSVQYDLSQIEPRRTYAVSARIDDATGRLMWITDTHNPLPPPGQSITLNLVRTGG